MPTPGFDQRNRILQIDEPPALLQTSEPCIGPRLTKPRDRLLAATSGNF